jgi:preprotein translocase subunit YajC
VNILPAFALIQAQQNPFNPSTLIFLALIFVVFYFMMIRPQQKRAKEREKMLNSIKKGDKVITSSGIHGKVVSTDEKTLLVDVGDNVRLKFERSAIGTITREAAGEEETK